MIGKRLPPISRHQSQLFFSGTSASTNNDTTSIAFLGLGNMGLPMATNLATNSNHPVIAFDLNEEATEKAKAVYGIQVAKSVKDAVMANMEGSSLPTIVTMLPGDAAVDSVMNAIAECLPDEPSSSSDMTATTIIDCSTVSPTTSRYWHDTLASKNCLFVDAPVSGGVKGAQDASLTFMVGGSLETVENTVVHSILSYMGSRVIPCGGPGSGAAVKLCNNLALAAQMVGICEAMNLGEALGVDPQVLADVMNTSTAKSWSCQVNNPHPQVAASVGSPASKDYEGGFGTRLMLKDLGLAVSAGKEAHVALPLGNVTKELYQMADLRGMGNKDFGVILQFLRGK
jgi:3-hydroxyisobutyrate dehydrogenase